MTERDKFILIVQTAAIVRDIQFDRRIADHVVHLVIEMPDKLLKFEEPDKITYYTAAIELIDFEYGLLDAFEEEYSDWLKEYIRYKFKDRADAVLQSKKSN